MTAVPCKVSFIGEFQDNRGFRSLVRLNGFLPDLSTSTATIAQFYEGAETNSPSVFGALAAMSNTKLVRHVWVFSYDLAQEPSSETGTYQLVTQKAELTGGDGNGLIEHLSIPGPKDAMFETTTQDNLIVVNPASTLITNLQSALATSPGMGSPSGGQIFTQFFGGQLRVGKPRRRRVLQGA